jgi:hypothetical protein
LALVVAVVVVVAEVAAVLLRLLPVLLPEVAAVLLRLLPVLLPEVAAVLLRLQLLQLPARLLREAQPLHPVPLLAVLAVPLPQGAEVAAVVLVQGLVASETLRRR